MAFNLKEIIGNIFNFGKDEEKQQAQQPASESEISNFKTLLQQVTGQSSKPKPVNPFINKQTGGLVNPYIDYRQALENPNLNDRTKKYIAQATGIPQSTKVVINDQSQSTSQGKGDIVSMAKKYLGTPYVWGGESMEEGGMDCSGFVYNALKDAGFSVGRTTAQEYRNQGSVIRKADLQPGDLIFYGKNNNATHIAIYLGNGQIIHSAGGSKNTKSNPGKGVSITTLNHRSDFIEGRRY